LSFIRTGRKREKGRNKANWEKKAGLAGFKKNGKDSHSERGGQVYNIGGLTVMGRERGGSGDKTYQEIDVCEQTQDLQRKDRGTGDFEIRRGLKSRAKGPGKMSTKKLVYKRFQELKGEKEKKGCKRH